MPPTTNDMLQMKLEGLPGDARAIPAQVFLSAGTNLEALLNQVQEATGNRDESFEWVIGDLRTGSAIISFAGRAKARTSKTGPAPVFARAFETLESFNTPDGPLPSWISYSVAERVKNLCTVVDRGMLTLTVGDAELRLTPKMRERSDALLRKRFVSFGSVEGTIETLSLHGSLPYFTLYHIIDRYALRCKCTTEQLEAAREAFGKRVRVIGKVERRFDGKVESIDLESIRVFPASETLPQPKDIRGIFSPDDIRPAHGEGTR